MSIYGNPAYRIDHDHTDRVGLRTIVISKLWQPESRFNPDDPLPMLEEAPAPPQAMPPGVLLVGQDNKPDGGAMRSFWVYEGVNGDPKKSVSFKTRETSIDFRFDPSFSSVSILLHPKIQDLLADYGGTVQDGTVTWGMTAPSGTAGFSVRSLTPDKNPLFGVTDFLRTEGTYSFRYLELSPAKAMGNAGKIVTTAQLPGVPPLIDGQRNWLMAPTPYVRRGPVYEILETYWLSGPGGWPKQIYGTGSQR